MRNLALALTLLLAVLLTGCGGPSDDDTSAPTDTITVTTEPEPADEPTTEPEDVPDFEDETADDPSMGLSDDTIDTLFTDLLYDAYPEEFVGAPVDTIVKAAKAMCGALDTADLTFTDLFNVMSEDYSAEAGGAFIGAGIQAYCPEHADIIPD